MGNESEKKTSIATLVVVALISAFITYAATAFIMKKSNTSNEGADITGSWYNTYNKQTFVLTLKDDKTFEYGYDGDEMTKGNYTNTIDVISLITDQGTDKIVYEKGKDYIEISSTKYYNSKEKAAENDAFFYVPDDYDTSMFTKITVAEMLEKFNKGEAAFVLTARGSCGYCQQFRPVAAQSVELYNYTLYYLDTTTVTSEDYQNISAIEGFEEFGSTPNVFYFKDKKVVDVQQGSTDINSYGSFLEKNGVTKK